MPLDQIVREWQRARNAAAGPEVSVVDAKHARLAGLPVLAALHTLAARLESANKHASTAEILAELRPIINLATGEAIQRAERTGLAIEIPGLPATITTPLLEDLA